MNENKINPEQMEMQRDSENRRGRLFGGIFIVIIGALFLGREMGIIIPDWIFTWQMLLIAIGVFTGLKHSFRSFGWIILIMVGAAFFLKEYAPWMEVTHYLWPITIIIVGLFMIFRPRRDYCKGNMKWQKYHRSEQPGSIPPSSEDFIDFNAVFGSIRKNIISKTFRGGEVNAVFGGAEINLMHADFSGTIELEINSIFAGTRLIIPSNWTLKSEVAAVMGSVEDKRPIMRDIIADPDKILILRGNAVFGGIEINSFS